VKLQSWMVLGAALAAAGLAEGKKRMKSHVTNSLGMRLVRVDSGQFAMGSQEGQGGDFDERPAHEVNISSSFYMAATEVTNVQYEKFDPSHKELRGKQEISTGDDEAAVFVSWKEARAFCDWLTKKEGKPYRLPTEAEWEYACRAGSATAFSTGETLPKEFHKNQEMHWDVKPVQLFVGKTSPNPWGLHDMHGNVEEWCEDWYGPYQSGKEEDPMGLADGDFKVTRGGSHGTELFYLRSANRSGALPEDKHAMLGFRVVQSEAPGGEFAPAPAPPLWAKDVGQEDWDWSKSKIQTSKQPFFEGPIQYVDVPKGSEGPLFSEHNHCPALTACPNGDLLAIWYTCRTEQGRELGIAASRLRRDSETWDPPSLFWDAPDRNDHASALLWDGEDTLFHFNGLSSDATWGKLALIMRTSKDNGATWSKARLVQPEHGLRHMPIANVFMTGDGTICLPCDAATGGKGGTALQMSEDSGKTWFDPGEGKPVPSFEEGTRGAWIAGIHAGVEELKDGRILAFGRGNNIKGRMPQSVSEDKGRTWTYSASPFPPIGGGQRLILRKLREGSLFFASFARDVVDANGERVGGGLFGALSFDEGNTWPVRRLITAGGDPRWVDGGGNTGPFAMSDTSAEPAGYMACVQTPDGVIHLISSKQYYRFNEAWLREGSREDE